MANYYYLDKTGREIGPFDLATLTKFRQAGVLSSETSVRPADSKEWKPCRELVPDFAPIITAGATAQPNASNTANGVYKILLVIAAIIIFITWQTNNAKQSAPDDKEKQFQNSIKSEVGEFNKDQAKVRDHLFGNQTTTPMRTVSEANECINNLRQLDAAANQFALEKGKRTGDPIDFPNDLTPYIHLNAQGKIPPCPSGGIYSISRVGDNPTCSLGNSVNPSHALQ